MPVSSPEAPDTNRSTLESAARAFFDDFVVAFRSFSGATIAERYMEPYLAFHADGTAEVFRSRAETGAYFQGIVGAYHARGCRSCRYSRLDVVPLGRNCVVATVSWDLLAEDHSVLAAWRESYNLCLVKDRFKAFASTDHVE